MKQSAVRARIRQLCCLGLPGELLVGALLPAIRELVPSDSAAFFWVDSRGEILKRLDAHHVLYGIVREQGAALGQLSLYRPMDAPAFTPRERADLASVMRYVAHGIAGDETRAGAGA